MYFSEKPEGIRKKLVNAFQYYGPVLTEDLLDVSILMDRYFQIIHAKPDAYFAFDIQLRGGRGIATIDDTKFFPEFRHKRNQPVKSLLVGLTFMAVNQVDVNNCTDQGRIEQLWKPYGFVPTNSDNELSRNLPYIKPKK